MNILRRLHRLYWESTGPTRFLTLFMYPAAAWGLSRAYEQGSSDIYWMFHIMPSIPEFCHALGWGLIITYIWCARVAGVLLGHPGYRWTLRTTPLLGCSFWLALLVSNIVDMEHLAFGLLYGVAVAMEAWILSRNWLETQ